MYVTRPRQKAAGSASAAAGCSLNTRTNTPATTSSPCRAPAAPGPQHRLSAGRARRHACPCRRPEALGNMAGPHAHGALCCEICRPCCGRRACGRPAAPPACGSGQLGAAGCRTPRAAWRPDLHDAAGPARPRSARNSLVMLRTPHVPPCAGRAHLERLEAEARGRRRGFGVAPRGLQPLEHLLAHCCIPHHLRAPARFGANPNPT